MILQWTFGHHRKLAMDMEDIDVAYLALPSFNMEIAIGGLQISVTDNTVTLDFVAATVESGLAMEIIVGQ